ncbi:MAG: HEAT repeat domain-containing protein [Planctomycetia bacterium]|nr:HEAT repeat domain-containing protein [Planctomycetia bacterium]
MHLTRHFARSVVVLAAFLALTAASVRAAEGTSPSPEKERELIALLRSDAPAAEKALACKNLAVHGSDVAVPELAKLLVDERLASWARIPLEVIPGAAADEALRKALDSTQGILLVGVLNSIGVRRDAGAVDPLTSRLQDADAEVASAAAVALGQIGNVPASKSLRKALPVAPAKVRSAVAEGLVLCAERFFVEGNAAAAAEIYDEVRKADVPQQRILEATRGAILSRKDEGIALLTEQFKSPDKALFQIALTTAREFPGRKIDEALAAEVTKAAPERAALIIEAMADRKETVVLPAIVKAAGKGAKPVRIAAIGALGRVGDSSCLSSLLEIAMESDAEVGQTAKTALADLPGEGVDKEIVARLAKAEGKAYPMLIELVGQRRIEAISALLKAVEHSDKTVRSAALTSLGQTIPAKNLSVLIAQVVSPKHADDAPVAQLALKTACVRMPDREACATELASGIEKSPAATKTILLEILSDVGGAKALNTIGTAAKSNDDKLQDTGSRLLGKWSSVDAAPVLLDLAKTSASDKYHVRAIRGYISLVRRFKEIPEPERLEMCQNAMAAARHADDQKLVLGVLKLYPSIGTLKLAVTASKAPELKDEATQTTLAIAQKIGGKSDEVRELLSQAGLEKVKLEIVKAEYGSGATQKDVTEVLQKQAGDLQLISLPDGNYNASFGGDPTPNTPKQLKIKYKINGKAGEATFAENALIILPMPK